MVFRIFILATMLLCVLGEGRTKGMRIKRVRSGNRGLPQSEHVAAVGEKRVSFERTSTRNYIWEPDTEFIKVHVTLISDGTRIQVDAEPDYTIEDVKYEVEEDYPYYRAENQILVKEGTVLTNHFTVDHYHITGQSTLFLIVPVVH